MKIAILQKVPFEYIGVMSISAVIRKLGHEHEVFISDIDKVHLSENVRSYSPDIIGFSLMSTDYKWFTEQLSWLRKTSPDIPIIVGGPHATFFPELIESHHVKAVFLGEAEETLEEFLSKYHDEDQLKAINGLWYKDEEGAIYKNPARPLLQDLDALRFPERGVYYDKYEILRMKEAKFFMSSRGCPYSCTFCFNKGYQNLYRGKGKYVRHFGQERIIQEIKETREKYGLKSVSFVDDVFTQDLDWVMRFLSLYKKEICLPFHCLVRANKMTHDLAKALKDAGVHGVTFGIESGSEDIRRNILNKRIRDSHIIECANILKHHRIQFGTLNMFGIPSETIDDAFKTVELNIRIKADFPWAFVLNPCPKTDIAKIAVQLNLIPENFDFKDLPASFFSTSPLNLPNKHMFENLQKIFYLVVKYPWSFPVFKKLIRINCPLIFKGLFGISFLLKFSKQRNVSFWKTIKIAWSFRNSF